MAACWSQKRMGISGRSTWKQWLQNWYKLAGATWADFQQTVHVFDWNTNIANGGDSAQDSPLDEATYGDRMNVQNLGRFGQGVNTRRKFHKQD